MGKLKLNIDLNNCRLKYAIEAIDGKDKVDVCCIKMSLGDTIIDKFDSANDEEYKCSKANCPVKKEGHQYYIELKKPRKCSRCPFTGWDKGLTCCIGQIVNNNDRWEYAKRDNSVLDNCPIV